MPQGWDWWLRIPNMGFGKDGKGIILRQSISQALGTLGQNTAILIGTKPAILERYRMIKTEVFAGLIGLTSGEGSNLLFGIADGDLSVAEIEEAIELAGAPVGPNDPVDSAIVERYVKWLGASDHEIATEGLIHNHRGGQLIEETIRWTFARTKSWNYFLYNLGAALTTGSSLAVRAKQFGVWVT